MRQPIRTSHAVTSRRKHAINQCGRRCLAGCTCHADDFYTLAGVSGELMHKAAVRRAGIGDHADRFAVGGNVPLGENGAGAAEAGLVDKVVAVTGGPDDGGENISWLDRA